MSPLQPDHRPRPRFGYALTAIALIAAACSGGAPAASQTVPASFAASSAPTAAASIAPTPAATPSAPKLAGLKLLWQGAGPLTGKVATYWPAINPITGDVWVAASRQNQFWIFKPDGTFLEAWGTGGKGDGQFKLTTNDPNPDSVGAIAFAPDGSFYVADAGNYRVERFDANRKFVTKWGSFGAGDGQFGSPKGIATDGKRVWVADDPRADIQVFDTSGKFLTKFPFADVLFSRSPAGLLVGLDPAGVTEVDGSGGEVHHIDAQWRSIGGDLSQTAVDAAGNVFIGVQTDSGPVGLIELDASGVIVNHWSTGGETLALSPDGKAIYFAYTGPPDVGWPYIQKYALP